MFPACAAAQETAPFNLAARYEFDWNGVPLGKVGIETGETATDYRMRSVVKSKGLVSLFANHTSDTSVKGNRAGGHYYPALYETNYQTRKKPKHIRITYDGAGHITQEVVEPVDAERPAVPMEDKQKAGDLLTTVFLLRQGAADALKTNAKSYDLDLYDGRRISHLHLELVGREKHRIGYKKRAVVHVNATRKPGAGYTPKELDRQKSEPSMHIYFSDDAAMIPLSMEVQYMGVIKGELAQQCKTIEECF